MALPRNRCSGLALLALAASVLSSCKRPLELASIATRNIALLPRAPRVLAHRIRDPYRPDARLAVLWIGHATVLIQIDDRLVLTDPVFTRSVGQLSTRLVEPGLDVADVPSLDAVLISHMHFDHLSLESLHLLQDRIGELVVPREGLVYIPPYRFPASELATWESRDCHGVRVTSVPVDHVGWRYGADIGWMTHGFSGYVIEYHGLTVYFGGDSAYAHERFVATAQRFPHIDLALIPIAPVEPRAFMASRHMDPVEALRAFRDLRAERMVPIHFDTFVNSADHVGDATRVLRRAMAVEHLTDTQVQVLEIGEQRVFVPRTPGVGSAGRSASPDGA